MNRRRIILPSCLAVLAAKICFGQGETYPDGTVSPFKPAFFGVGITEPAVASYVFGVGAQGGGFYGAVGQINGVGGGSEQQPALFYGPKSFFGLPRLNDAPSGGTALGISDDGKIKIGFGPGNGVYWDVNNQVHALPSVTVLDSDGTPRQSALPHGITPDGTLIAGEELTEIRSDGLIYEACKWTPNGSAPLRLGIPDGFQSSHGNAISEGGEAVAGDADHYDGSTSPPTSKVRAFVSVAGQARLLAPDGDADTNAYGISKISSSDFLVVGNSGSPGATRALLWIVGNDSQIRVLDGVGRSSTAWAVRANCYAPSGALTRIVGESTNESGGTAFMWDYVGAAEGTIAGILKNIYGRSVGSWQLTVAYALSGDGYTVGGIGINSEHKTEGWVAVMPPILHPPMIIKPPDQTVLPDTTFIYQVKVKNTNPTKFSARGLPPGFEISSEGVIVGTWSASQTGIAGTRTVTVTAKNSEGSSTATFKMILQPPPTGGGGGIKKMDIEGHGFLQQNKPPDEETFLASFSNGTSADGQVAVGQDGFGDDARAYRWTTAEGATGLPMLDGALRTYSTALAVSADGQTIVGQAASAPADNGTSRSVAVVWRTAAAIGNVKAQKTRQRHYAESETSTLEAIDLGLFPKGTLSSANGVSANGSVVVGYHVGRDPDPDFKFDVYQAFRWTQATGMVGLGWLDTQNKFSQAFGVSADGSVIVGLDSSQAFRWTEATGMVGLGKGPGALASVAKAISADNSTIIGYNTYNPQNDNNRAFRWRAGEGFVDLGVLPGDQYSEAKAVSADGSVIVGVSGVKFVSARAFIWDQANGMRDLKSVLVADNPSLASWTLTSADAVSADGKTITGAGTNPNGDREGFTAVLQVRPAQLLNIATRMRVLPGDKALIGGFIITGTEPKRVMIRGIGPSLAAFFSGALADPTLTLFQANTTIANNDNWKTRTDGSSQEAEIQATTIPPGNDLESAIVITLNPGAYTAILADKNGAPGIGVVEVFDLAQQTNSKLANISTRGFVDTGDNVMIGGFIAGGGTPGATAGEVIRAIGPSLTAAGVTDALQDTTLELYNGSGTLLASNDDWKLRADGTSQEAEIQATTLPPSDDRESALAVTLTPGNYTAIVRGKGSATGIGVVEVYHLQ